MSGFEAKAFAPVISEIEGPRFAQSLLDAIWQSVAQIDHCSIFQFDPSERVHHIATASIISLEGGVRSSERYADGLYAYDPMRAVLRESSGNECIRVYQLKPQQIRDHCYRRHFAELQTVDRVSMLTRSNRSWYSLNLYRSKASGSFAESELAELQDAAPLLAALAKKHTQMRTMERKLIANKIEEYLQTVLQPLSRQERSVCKLMLLGHKSKAIAEQLGLRHNTVLTYRKRAYAKLNVSSQRELFGLCLTPSAVV